MNIKEDIINLAKKLGFLDWLFMTKWRFDYLDKSLRLAVEEGRNSGFEHKNIEERIKLLNWVWLLPRPLSLSQSPTPQAQATAFRKRPAKRGKFTP